MINSDVLQGKWTQLKGEVRQRWGGLTDNDLDQINGNREKLAGLLQQKYGYEKARADQEINSFLAEYETRHGKF